MSEEKKEIKTAEEEKKAKEQAELHKLIEQNTEFENQIKSEISKEQPITKKTPFDAILAEYTKNKFYPALETLSKSFKIVRRARRDGNCFYRSYLIQLLEFLSPYSKKMAVSPEAAKIEEKLKKSKEFLQSAGYDTIVFEDSYDLLMKEIEKLKKIIPEKFEETLINIVSNKDTSNYLLFYLRMLTGAYIKKNAEFFINFITAPTIEDYCNMEVEHFDSDCYFYIVFLK